MNIFRGKNIWEEGCYIEIYVFPTHNSDRFLT